MLDRWSQIGLGSGPGVAVAVSAAALALFAAATWLARRRTRSLLAELERSTRRYEALSRHASDLCLLLDRSGRILQVGRSVERVLGRLPGELEGLCLPDAVHPDDRERVRRAIAQNLIESEEPLRLDLRIADGSGAWSWLEAIGSNLLGVEEVGALVVNARDVSGRRAAEARVARLNRVLRASTEVGEAVLRAADEASLLDEACRIAVGTGGYRLVWVGWKDAGHSGLVVPAAVSGEGRGYLPQIAVRWDETPLGDGPTGRAIRLGRAQATTDVEQDVVMTPWRARLRAVGARSSAALPIRIDGEVAGALSVYATEAGAFDEERLDLLGALADNLGRGVHLHRLRQERDRMEAALRASEASLRELFDRVPIGLYRTTPTGEFLDGNSALLALLGLGDLETLRRTPVEAVYADPADRTAWRAALERDGQSTGLEVRIRRKDGETIVVRHSTRAVRDAAGAVVAYEGAAEDVTARVRAEEAHARALEELQRSNHELQQFAYIASHDLQEPLRMVVSYLGLLERRLAGTLDDEQRKFLGYAVEGGRRMQQLVQGLLELSRVGTRGEPMAAVEVDRVLDVALANLEVAVRESGAEIEREPLPAVEGDPGQLVQLLQNLLSNALKFHGARPPRIRVSAARDGDRWRIAIEDRGLGIEPRHRERIFEVFQRLHRRDEYPGTGIGLSICRRIAQRHGGRIWVEETPGGGATFLFTLPQAREVSLAP